LAIVPKGAPQAGARSMTAMLKVMSASIAFSAAFSSTAFAGVQNWGPPLMSAQIIRKNIRAKCAGCISAVARR